MSIRTIALVGGVAAAATLAIAVPAANATPGPPPPVSTNGHPVHLVASGLKTPTSFAFGDGMVFVGDGGNSEGSAPPNGGVYVVKNGAGVKVPSRFAFVGGLAWHNNALYVSGGVLTPKGPRFRIMKWTHWTGTTFTKRTAVYLASKDVDGLNGIAFGANGRIYVGVDVGLTDGNDHGPRTTSAHVYQILSFRGNGGGAQVFARGIRQPWQLAFQHGSNSPFVTDLGQDSGATNPPDFILHVTAGQDYGFPMCNHLVASKCAGFAKPFRSFGPHTDLMGIAVHDGTFYLSSFLGRKGMGPGGTVFTLKMGGGVLKPLLKGFVAPTVGLGMHNGFVYVGELTGQVFRVRV